MNNKLLGTTFAALLGSTVLFFGVTQAGSYVIDEVVFPTDGFADQTYIGPFDVSNLPEEEAAVTVQTGVQGWFDEAHVNIKLQDAVVPFPLEAVQFNTDRTLTTAQDGTKNGLEFDVTEEAVGTFLNQQFPPFIFSEEEVTTVTGTIRQHLALGRKDQIVDITDALVASSTIETTITNVTFDNAEISEGMRTLIFALDGYKINPKSTFSFLEFVEGMDASAVTESDLTTVASILYASILQTNFSVDERSIGPIIPVTVPLGLESSINRELGVDFVFTNPNSTTFTLNINEAGNGLNASLTGFPFVYRYETTTGNLEEFPPKTIKQFSAFVNQNTVQVKTQGVNGLQVAVFKNVLSGTDEVIDTMEVSKDFYPPVHKVEIHPLTVTESTEATGDGSSTPSETTGTDGATGSTESPGTNTGDSTDQPAAGTDDEVSNGDSTGSGRDAGSSAGANDKEDELQYDKGGNLIPSSK